MDPITVPYETLYAAHRRATRTIPADMMSPDEQAAFEEIGELLEEARQR